MKKILPTNKFSQAGPVSPIVMVTCVDANGKPNIITLGMFMSISIDPLQVCIGVSPERYSHNLIEEKGEFVVNCPGIELEDAMHLCGIKSGRKIDKFKEFNLTAVTAQKVEPPLIEECYGHLECKTVNRLICGDHTLFVREVIAASVRESCYKDGKLDLSMAKPIAQKNWLYHTLSDKKIVPSR